ncbi:MAG: AAA family ATPase [Candidatus Rhabdochlamydia sp.]
MINFTHLSSSILSPPSFRAPIRSMLITTSVIQLIFLNIIAAQNKIILPASIKMTFAYLITVALLINSESRRAQKVAFLMLIGSCILQLGKVIHFFFSTPTATEELSSTSTSIEINHLPPFLQQVHYTENKKLIELNECKAVIKMASQAIHHSKSFLIQGGKGSGKTSTLQMVAHSLNQQGKEVYQLLMPHFIDSDLNKIKTNIEEFYAFFQENPNRILLIDNLENCASYELLNMYAPYFLLTLFEHVYQRTIQMIATTAWEQISSLPLIPAHQLKQPHTNEIILISKHYLNSSYPQLQLRLNALSTLILSALEVPPCKQEENIIKNSFNFLRLFKNLDEIILKSDSFLCYKTDKNLFNEEDVL